MLFHFDLIVSNMTTLESLDRERGKLSSETPSQVYLIYFHSILS